MLVGLVLTALWCSILSKPSPRQKRKLKEDILNREKKVKPSSHTYCSPNNPLPYHCQYGSIAGRPKCTDMMACLKILEYICNIAEIYFIHFFFHLFVLLISRRETRKLTACANGSKYEQYLV